MRAQETVSKTDNKIHTVVIDPGHGGKDPGAVGKKGKEKDIVLDIGLKLGNYIEQNFPDVKVIYTRKTDEFIPLHKRAEIANENKADLFISLHVNGWSDPESFGTETLVLGRHRQNENLEVTKRENAVIFLEEDHTVRYAGYDPDAPESFILFKILQNVYDEHSTNFADYVQDQFRERAKRHDRGIRRQGLLVLAQTSMPGALIEMGFITNPTEEKYLMSEDGQAYIASAIYRAFKEYKQEIESKSFSSDTELKVASHTETPAASGGPVDPIPKITPQTVDKQVDNNPEGDIYFKVQVLSSSTSIPLDSSEFSDFNDVEEFIIESIYKYAVGYKKSYEEIVEYSQHVKKHFPDAFIIAVQNGTIIPVQKAQKLLN